MLSVRVFRTIYVEFFRSDFGGSPKEIADPAVKKNGEKQAVDESVWKSPPCGADLQSAPWAVEAGVEKRLDAKEAVNAQVLWHVEQLAGGRRPAPRGLDPDLSS